MNHLTLTAGLLVDAEVAYRRERLAVEMAGARRARGWWGTRRRRNAARLDDLTLAA